MGKTHNNHFNEEQIEILGKNFYVKSVSVSTVRFTEEFKNYFYQQYHSGMSARKIFSECGIDPDILGESRIEGLCYTLNKQARRESGFIDNRSTNFRKVLCDGDNSNITVDKRLKQLEHELAYTRQEVEFLKKIQMADMEARKQWEFKHQPR